MEIPMHAIHMDSDLYPDPALFEPFRFAPKEALPSNAGPHAGEKPQPLITIEETFLGFGYGRSGCPGRFFASHLLKVMFAYIVQNYDIEYMETRPKMIELMEFRFPNEKSTVRVRRRQ
jgi:cytochrome P450